MPEKTFNEIFVEEAKNNFDFLKLFGYTIKKTETNFMFPYILYENKEINRKISLTYEGVVFVSIMREPTRIFPLGEKNWNFPVHLAYEKFNALDIEAANKNPFEGLKKNSTFLQACLMAVIKGEKWLDVLKNSKTSK